MKKFVLLVLIFFISKKILLLQQFVTAALYVDKSKGKLMDILLMQGNVENLKALVPFPQSQNI